jgi:hypothetical protein
MNNSVIGNLFSIIKQIPEKYSSKTTCPFCDSKNVHCRGTMVTAVGGGSSERGNPSNPNHYAEDNKCGDCQKLFSKQFKGDHQWYQDNESKVVKGFHGCFETAIYNCIDCDGEVSRTYTDSDGVTPTKGLCSSSENGKWVHHYREFWNCKDCKNGVEINLNV